MQRWIAAILFIATACAAQVVNGQPSDGHWWKGLSPLAKTALAAGFIVGTDRASDKTLLWCMTHDGYAARATLPTALDQKGCLQEVKPLDLGNATSVQIADGLDQLYGDFLNEQIPIRWALDYVCDELIGTKSAADLNAELLLLRKEAGKESAKP